MLYLRSINRFILISLALFGLSVSSANASVIYTFDVSDVSWASTTSGTFTDVKFWFEFTDTADLNALSNANLISMGVTTLSGSESSTLIGKNNINDIFGIIGGVASLTVGGHSSPTASIHEFSGSTALTMQVGSGGAVPLLYDLTNGESGVASGLTGTHTYYSISSVPVPAAIWLFGTALIGLVGFGKRKSRIAA